MALWKQDSGHLRKKKLHLFHTYLGNRHFSLWICHKYKLLITNLRIKISLSFYSVCIFVCLSVYAHSFNSVIPLFSLLTIWYQSLSSRCNELCESFMFVLQICKTVIDCMYILTESFLSPQCDGSVHCQPGRGRCGQGLGLVSSAVHPGNHHVPVSLPVSSLGQQVW